MSDTLKRLNPDTIAPPVGLYSQGTVAPAALRRPPAAGRWLYSSQPWRGPSGRSRSKPSPGKPEPHGNERLETQGREILDF